MFSNGIVAYLHEILCNPNLWKLIYTFQSSRFALMILAENASFTLCHVMFEYFSLNIWVSEKTNKFIGALSTASPVLLFVVSFEEVHLGTMITVNDQDNFSTTAIPVGGKTTHGKVELVSTKWLTKWDECNNHKSEGKKLHNSWSVGNRMAWRTIHCTLLATMGEYWVLKLCNTQSHLGKIKGETAHCIVSVLRVSLDP